MKLNFVFINIYMEEGPTQTFYQHSLGGADGLEERFILRKLGRHPSKN